MRKTLKKLVATAMAAVTIAAPAKAAAEEAGVCPSYDQVASNATGGDWVGGRLIYESTSSVAVTEPSPSTTITVAVPIPGGAMIPVFTFSTTIPGTSTTTTTQMPVGYYKMVDGSVWQINCITGAATQIS